MKPQCPTCKKLKERAQSSINYWMKTKDELEQELVDVTKLYHEASTEVVYNRGEIIRLKAELAKADVQGMRGRKCPECARLRGKIAVLMSERPTMIVDNAKLRKEIDDLYKMGWKKCNTEPSPDLPPKYAKVIDENFDKLLTKPSPEPKCEHNWERCIGEYRRCVKCYELQRTDTSLEPSPEPKEK